MFLFHLIWGSTIGRCITAIVAGLIAVKAYGLQQQYKGKQEVIQQSVVEGTKNNEQAKKNVDALSNDKYYSKRMRQFCRDCK